MKYTASRVGDSYVKFTPVGADLFASLRKPNRPTQLLQGAYKGQHDQDCKSHNYDYHVA